MESMIAQTPQKKYFLTDFWHTTSFEQILLGSATYEPQASTAP
jgi:hypothetical protein